MTEISMENHVAIVTGAGGGLGRAYALELARRGARVVVNDTGGALDGQGETATSAQLVVDEITAAGGTAVASCDSVATPEGGAAIVATALDTYGQLDIVVNNAGILRDRSIGKIDWADFDAVHDVHLKGALHVSQPAFAAMRERRYGRFVFISSNAGTFGNFGQAAYGSAKAGVIGLANVFAIEGERAGIKSNVVCPLARTRMTEKIMGEDTGGVSPDEVAPLVAYLASEECDVNHAVFSAGGGHFSRVFTGLTVGWQVPHDESASAEAVAEHMLEISDPEDFLTPLSAPEELAALAPFFEARAKHRTGQ